MRKLVAASIALASFAALGACTSDDNGQPPQGTPDAGAGLDATIPGADASPGADGAVTHDSSTGDDGATTNDAANDDASNDAGPTVTSCLGLPATCGAASNDDCCATLPVAGGTFDRSASGSAWDGPAATISAFHLDKYEVTVGRFRAFVAAGMGTQASPPAAGSGANPHVAGSGWDSSFNAGLPANTAALEAALTSCGGNTNTWTNDAGALEDHPIDCTTWPLAFAFCAWDGARLPTEAEWAFAAAGGDEQRHFAWPDDAGYDGSAVDPSYATYGCNDGGLCVTPVGMHPSGAGKWGQLDLTGNVHEWSLDYYHPTPPSPCTDCADLDASGAQGLTFHGGSFGDGVGNIASWNRFYTFDVNGAETPAANIGVRCARDP